MTEYFPDLWYNMRVKIGEYEILRPLGKGGMSEVYEVADSRTGAHHALKLYAYPKEDAEVRRRFEAEGKLLAHLSHPRIVKVTDIGEDADEGRPFFVMDLILSPDGSIRTLADVSAGEADEGTIGKWYDDIRDALGYIHCKGVIHRDLKLQNVLIGADGHAVVTDFGISRIFVGKALEEPLLDPVQTIMRVRDGKNLVMGSLGYMAPELEMGLAASEKSDWYALGVIVYRLLTGTWCDSRTDVAEMLDTYDPVWKRIVPKLLHSNPEGRECLSYVEEKAKDAEALEAAFLKEKRHGNVARHLTRYAAAAVVLLAVALAVGVREHFAQREMWRLRFANLGLRQQVPSFAEMFRIPAEARGDETIDDDGNVKMPSRAQFEAARVDALVLSQPVLSRLESGDIPIERAIADFEKICEMLDEDSQASPFDGLRFGDADYMQFGENEPLKVLFERAIEKLREVAER